MELELPITCPQCSRQFKANARKLKPGNTLTCPGCGVSINLKGDDLSKAAKALDDFERALKSLGGKRR